MRQQNVSVLSDRQVQSLQDLANSCKSVAHLREYASRAGYHVPALKSKMCDLQYLHAVMERRVYCLKTENIRIKNCPRPPAPKVLLRLLLTAAGEDGLDLGIRQNKPPDARWMLEVLSTMRPGLYIFDKGYVPDAADRGLRNDAAQQVDNSDGFWTGQPRLGEIGRAAKSHFSVLNRLLGGDSIELKIRQLQERRERFNALQDERLAALEIKRSLKGQKQRSAQELELREEAMRQREQQLRERERL